LERKYSFTLNGKDVSVEADGSRMLVYVLRYDLGLTGTKVGCGEGICGACTVVVNGEALRSCSIPLERVEGKSVLTIEGVDREGILHALREAFLAKDAYQCGYCTPGMILSAHALLKTNPKPNRDQVIAAMEGNLCRCGAHVRIVEAVLEAANGGGVR
jgi:nicotinate dehydrogenase subunit A